MEKLEIKPEQEKINRRWHSPNSTPLTPISFLKRAAKFYPDHISIIYGRNIRFTWKQTYHRCLRLASFLRSSFHLSKHDVVSVLAPNVPALYEMHFGVPMAGAVLNTINTRLDPNTIKTILAHSSAKLFFVDYQFIPLATDALRLLTLDNPQHGQPLPLPIVIDDLDSPTGLHFDHDLLHHHYYTYQFQELKSNVKEYEQLIRMDDNNVDDQVDDYFLMLENCVDDEWDPIALNYTSGTTSTPKGVVSTHRGAYLCTLSLIIGWEMGSEPVYLWTIPMFHCNGWTFTWGVAARGGTNICIRSTAADEIYSSIEQYGVTHMCCAPVVLNKLLEAGTRWEMIGRAVNVLTGGAPPEGDLMARIERLGFRVMQGYGLTEVTGPALICEWKKEWNELPEDEKMKLKERQGVSIVTMADVDVKDSETLESIPNDGKSMGEIVLRGSGIMKGYLKDEETTRSIFKEGWFWTGDVAVVHPNGHIEIKDRSKDIIISGGENISSIEVESVLLGHPDVTDVAVVAMPHPRWGESPCAFVVVAGEVGGVQVTEEGLLEYCSGKMARYKIPKKVVFVQELPRTATGKVKKAELREIARGFNLMVGEDESAGKVRGNNTPTNNSLSRL